jgi:hypothetical protein
LSSSHAGDSEVSGEIGVDVVRAFHSLTSAPSQRENDPFGQQTRPTSSFEEIFVTWFGVAGFACGKSAQVSGYALPGAVLGKTAAMGSGEFGRRIGPRNAVICSIDSGVASSFPKNCEVAQQAVPRGARIAKWHSRLSRGEPQSEMGKAIRYTLNQWEKLMVTLNDGEIELSTNLAENSMRPVALGRKNWLHIGGRQAGPKVVAVLSLVESCRRLGISVKDYLSDILLGLRNRPAS